MARQVGDKWLADFVLNGQRKRIKCDSKAEAERLEAQPVEVAKRAADPTVGEVFLTWAHGLWDGTRDERSSIGITRQLVDDLGRDKKVRTITSEDVTALRQKWMAKGNAPRTINTKLAKLSKLLTYAVEEAKIMEGRPKTKFNKVRKGRIRALSPNEEGAILGGLRPDFRMLAQFLLYTGCRVSEALNLDWKDVDFDGGSVTFWDTKNGEERSIPLHAKAYDALVYANDHLPGPSPWSSIAYDTFIKAWRKAKASAGLGDDRQVVPHVLRHTCATRLGKGRMDPLRLQQWMGHSSLEMTKRYTHLNVDDLRAGADLL